MTNEQAIELLNHTIVIDINDERKAKKQEAIRMGVDALKAQKVGQWITLQDEYGDIVEAVCSCCNQNGNHEWAFCPKCGARMEGQE